jgi:hypothetical protein
MSVIPFGQAKIYNYCGAILEYNTLYDEEDKKWIQYSILKNFNDIEKNIYYILSIINVKCFTGYFSRIFGDKLYVCIKNKNENGMRELLLNPTFPEIYDNKNLEENEIEMLKTVVELDILTTNLTVKRLCVNNHLINNIHNAFEESYNNIYYNVYQHKTEHNRLGFEDFVILTEENEHNIKYAHTFGLYDILTEYIYSSFTVDISQGNITKLKDKYYTELKLVYNYIENKNS